MKPVVVIFVSLLVGSFQASAETYSIIGTAKFSNGPPVSLEDVTIECAEFEYDCHSFRGMGSETNRFGEFEISIEGDDSYDGAELILTILGESFPHVIELEDSRSSSDSVNHDIILDQKSPPSNVFTGFGCAVIVILLAFLAAIGRLPQRTPMSTKIRTLNPRILNCPVCDGRLEGHLLIRHLIVGHQMDVEEASVLAQESFDSEE